MDLAIEGTFDESGNSEAEGNWERLGSAFILSSLRSRSLW